jgi:hypothetical protein
LGQCGGVSQSLHNIFPLKAGIIGQQFFDACPRASSLSRLWIFAPSVTQNPDYPACANLRFDGSLQGKKAPCSCFFGILCAKRNKLLG